MTDPPPGYSPAPGISRATAFRPDLVLRVVLSVLAAAFAAVALQQALAGRPVAVMFLLVLLVGSTGAALKAWTTRVWVETSYPTGWVEGTSPDPGRPATISELLAGAPASRDLFVVESAGLTGVRRREALLEHPSTIALSGAALTGPRPSWRLVVTSPARDDRPAATVTVRSPWLTDLRPLLRRLSHVVLADERLAADADTLALVSGRRPLRG